MLCCDLRTNPVRIAAQLMICPVLDVGGDRPSRRLFAQGYFLDAETILRDAVDCGFENGQPLACSPLHRGDLSGLPPTLVHTAEFDIVRDDGTEYAARVQSAGVPTRLTCHLGMIHYFYALGRLIPKSRLILAAIGAELACTLENPVPSLAPEGVFA